MQPDEYIRMDAAEARMWWYRALHRRLIGALAHTKGTVLDTGCGTGGFLAALRTARPDLRLFGLEWNAAASQRAAEKSDALITRGTVNAIPFANASFDAAVSADVLCHAAVEPGRALAELRRTLRPGGLLVINMPAYAWLMSEHDRNVHNIRRQTRGQTASLLREAGFGRVRTRYWNGLLLPLMVVRRKLLRAGRNSSDVAVFPPWLDATLYFVTELERQLPFALPAGSSVLAMAERP